MNKNKIIVLDPGHGLDINNKYQRPMINMYTGKIVNPNKKYNEFKDVKYYREDIGTLLIAEFAKQYLNNNGYSNVYLTRKNELNAERYLSDIIGTAWKRKFWKNKSWKWIQDYTKQCKADLFVSIHTNAADGSVSGTVAFHNGNVNSINLAKNIVDSISSDFNLFKRVKKHKYLILRSISASILIECLFHDNANDINLLINNGIEKIGISLAKGIINYLDNVSS